MESRFTVKSGKGNFQLVRQKFLNESVSIRLPEFLKDLSEDERKNRRLSLPDSDVLKMNKEHKVMFALSVNDFSLRQDEHLDEEERVAVMLEAQRRVVSRIAPGYQEYGVHCKKIDGRTVGYLKYKSNSIEDDIYNIFYLFFGGDKMITGVFSGLMADMEEWNHIFLVCLDTLKLNLDKT